uniref:Ribosome production factor 2 homolog n=1 Tax=Ficedula albicollis TaxID=59894 RepID=U3K8F1_FICAL
MLFLMVELLFLLLLTLTLQRYNLWVEDLFLISNLTLPRHNFRPFPRLLALVTTEISACPSSSPEEEAADCNEVSPRSPRSRMNSPSALSRSPHTLPRARPSARSRPAHAPRRPRRPGGCDAARRLAHILPHVRAAMEALDRVVKPKTKRAKRFLEKREPKLNENTKNAMLIKGGNANLTVTEVLKDIYAVKKPFAVLYKKKNITRPFEDQTSLEFFSKKSDCSLFLFGSHNKKRPNNLVIGRMFDYHVLDMVELGVEKFVSLKEIKNSKCPEGTKPMLIFAGDMFDVNEEYRRLKSLLIDFFRGPTVPSIRLAGLEYVLHFTAVDGKIYMRSYKVLLKKSGCKIPRIELEEMGPSLDLVMRRTHLASDDLYKLSLKQPKGLKPKKKKNISHDVFRSYDNACSMKYLTCLVVSNQA